MSTDYYNEKKYCDTCKDYVRYIMSVNQSYCTQCGGAVRLFNKKDTEEFTETVQRHRWQAS